jgi:hypothetical protein
MSLQNLVPDVGEETRMCDWHHGYDFAALDDLPGGDNGARPVPAPACVACTMSIC